MVSKYYHLLPPNPDISNMTTNLPVKSYNYRLRKLFPSFLSFVGNYRYTMLIFFRYRCV